MGNRVNELSAKEARKLLDEGNARYQSIKNMEYPNISQARRTETKGGQWPFAIVLSCADSRVIPETIFDRGIGDLFVMRVAGNIAEDQILASIEYAIMNLNTKLIVVMGHEKCGAVGASMGDGPFPGHISSLVDMIKPAVTVAKSMGGDDDTVLKNAVELNAKIVAGNIRSSQDVINEYVVKHDVEVVSAYYELESGKVTFH